MAKIIALLALLCVQFSWGEEIAAVETPEEGFPQQAILETYPLDIKLDKDDTIHEHVQTPIEKILKNPEDSWKTNKANLQQEYVKVTEAIEKWMQQNQPKFANYMWLRIVESGTDAKCAKYYYDTNFKGYGKFDGDTTNLWSDYTQITIDVETWLEKSYPDMGMYKWLKIIEEGSYESGIVPRCPDKVESTYDYYEQNSNGLGGNTNAQNGWQGGLTAEDKMWDEYSQITLDIEGWIAKANPDLQFYEWLEILEEGGILKGRIPECSENEENTDDYYNEDNEISWKKNKNKLLKAYDEIVSAIEKWMQKAHPEKSNYVWLDAIDKGTKADCDYDYYYDIDAYLGDGAYGVKLPSYNKPKNQFKRFTSV